MMKSINVIFFCVICKVVCYSQSSYQQLLEAASSQGLFVNIHPIAKIAVDSSNINEYLENLHDDNVIIKKDILLEIIDNAKKVDTALWRKEELNKFILVPSDRAVVDLNYIKKQFSKITKSQLKYYRKILAKFRRGKYAIYSYSRPVFDNSNKYAIVQYNYPPSGIIVSLFFLEKSVWMNIGVVSRISY